MVQKLRSRFRILFGPAGKLSVNKTVSGYIFESEKDLKSQ